MQEVPQEILKIKNYHKEIEETIPSWKFDTRLFIVDLLLSAILQLAPHSTKCLTTLRSPSLQALNSGVCPRLFTASMVALWLRRTLTVSQALHEILFVARIR